jgi:AcrR family transcriptional regulator
MSTALPERRTQVERRNRSEDALLDAAAELVAERGVDRASLARIGERAGVSRGLPTHHFGTKDELVARLAARAQDRIERAMEAAAEERHGRSSAAMSGLDIVLLTADAYLEIFGDPSPYERALLVMWGSTFPSATGEAGMTDAERRSYDGLSNVIARGQHDGSIRRDLDPVASAVLVLGTIRGVAGLLLTDSTLVDMGRVRDTCRDLITSGLGTASRASS